MLQVNVKKPITLRNRTNYFDPSRTRVKNTFSSPSSYQNRQMKIEGYETRLYWQFRYCEDHDGQTFFYTLTYNDANLPNHYGVNCFDYNDLTDLVFEGAFRKQLLRQYGTKMKYFVGAELGDGKGSRGMHNNPHYHVLFFLENANNDRYPYVKISPEDFRHLVRKMWQGFDQDTDGKHDYRDAKKGIAREGENCGKVTDYRACMYCAKYVCKDVKLVMAEDKVRKYSKMQYRRDLCHPEDGKMTLANAMCRRFFNEVLMKKWRTLTGDYRLLLDDTLKSYKPSQVISYLCPDLGFATFLADLDDPRFRWYDVVQAIVKSLHCWSVYSDFRRVFMEDLIRKDINAWRNIYTNKVRCSQGIGSYALDFIDPMNPTVQVACKKGFKNRPLPMYYYRKLYMKVVKDPKGQNLYILNDLGREYKLSRLSKQIDKLKDTAANYVQLCLNEDFFKKVRESDCNTTSFMSFPNFFKRYNYLLNENKAEEIFTRYAEYKLVYENRFFPYDLMGSTDLDGDTRLPVVADYTRFLVPSYYTASYDPDRCYKFVQDPLEGWLPYSQHPYFLRYLGFFALFDSVADYLFVKTDDKKQKDAEERAATKRYHTERELKKFYETFSNDALFIDEPLPWEDMEDPDPWKLCINNYKKTI